MTIAAIIGVSSNQLLSQVQESSAKNLAQQECPDVYDFKLEGCYTSGGGVGQVELQVANLGEAIPSESQILLESGPKTFFVDLPQEVNITKGGGGTIKIEYNTADLSDLKKVKLLPSLDLKGTTVLCENSPYLEINLCT